MEAIQQTLSGRTMLSIVVDVKHKFIAIISNTTQHNQQLQVTLYIFSFLNMCEFCDPRPRAGPIDMTMGDNRSFQFFSMAAIDEALRQTSKGSTPVCDLHRGMFCMPIQQEQSDENNTEEADGEGDDEEDGT